MSAPLVTLVLLLAAPRGASQEAKPHDHEAMQRLHRDPKAYVALLEDPGRDAHQKPDEVLKAWASGPARPSPTSGRARVTSLFAWPKA